MGEYAKRIATGERVKIGTCEDMLYLRASQIGFVRPEHGNVDPADPETQRHLRFRFPWPDEDGVAPGYFEDPFKRLRVEVAPPAEFEHGIVQFVAQREGYNVCLPCPEGPSEHGLRVNRNGFAGAAFLTQQAYRNGVLAAIFQCVCGRSWNAPTLVDAAPAIEGLLAQAERYERDRQRAIARDGKDYGPDPTARRLTEIALRIGAGYRQEALA